MTKIRITRHKIRQGLTLPCVYINRKSETVTNDNKFRIILCWWRRRYSKPRPKISPRNFLRAYSLYKHSLCQKPNDRRLISVALLCVMSYKAVAHSHLLLLDAPFGTAVLPEGTAALIRQQVKLRFCRLFLNFEAFMVVPRHRSLITTQNPRRNPFVPVFI